MELAELKYQTAGLRLLIVDDHALCCTGLAMMFRAVPEVAEVAVATTSEQAVRIAKLHQPDVLIMDAAMPSYRGFETARLLVESSGRCRILFLDDAVNHAHIRSALRAGALGYWTKHATFDEITVAVLRISAGHAAFCPAADQHLIRTKSGLRFEPRASGTRLDKLTPRELEVLLHLADGLSVRRCAERMRLSESTVDNHKSRLMRKLDVHNLVELVRLAAREGLLQ
jgi:DNA-binding NarL/FixJ family response regulator